MDAYTEGGRIFLSLTVREAEALASTLGVTDNEDKALRFQDRIRDHLEDAVSRALRQGGWPTTVFPPRRR